MTDRELLKEARELIVAMVNWSKAIPKLVGYVPDTGFQNAEGLLSRIDTALADHSPDAGNMVAMELVEKIRDGVPKCMGGDTNGGLTLAVRMTLTDSEAAALIESYGRRVPRKMLFEIEGNAQWNGMYDSIIDMENTIAAKYGVKIEEDGI